MKIYRDRKGDKKITLTQTEAECLRRAASLVDDIGRNMPSNPFDLDFADTVECLRSYARDFGPKVGRSDHQQSLPLDPPEPISEATPCVLDAQQEDQAEEPPCEVPTESKAQGGYIDPLRKKRGATNAV